LSSAGNARTGNDLKDGQFLLAHFSFLSISTTIYMALGHYDLNPLTD